MPRYEAKGRGFPWPNGQNPRLNIFATEGAQVRTPDGAPLVNLIPSAEPTSSRAVILASSQGPRLPQTPRVQEQTHRAGSGTGSEHSQGQETEIVDPVEQLARQLYGDWRAMVQTQLASDDERVLIQNRYATELVRSAIGGSKQAQEDLKERLVEFGEREKRALSEGYPPTSGWKAFGRGVARGLKHAPQPWAPYLGASIERLSHRDASGQVINDKTTRDEELHDAARALTSHLLKSALESSQAQQIHPQVRGLAQQAHDAAHDRIKQGHQNTRMYTTLAAFQTTEQMGEQGEALVLNIFRDLARMQLKLEEDLRSANPRTLKFLMELGEISGLLGAAAVAALATEGVRRAREGSQQRQLPSAGNNAPRQLPPPSTRE